MTVIQVCRSSENFDSIIIDLNDFIYFVIENFCDD